MRAMVIAAGDAEAPSIRQALDASGIRCEFTDFGRIMHGSTGAMDVDAYVLRAGLRGLAERLDLLCRRIAKGTPVIVLGDRDATGIEEAISLGASDYAEELHSLAARVKAQVNRHRSNSSAPMKIGRLWLLPDISAVRLDGHESHLSAREFALLRLLAQEPGRVVPIATIAARVWGRSSDIARRTIEQHVYRLRRKLHLDGLPGSRIRSVYGVGYSLDVRETERPVALHEPPHLGQADPAPLQPQEWS